MNIELTPNEARVIGCLMEKSVITPDQYPLSLNALIDACNQKSSRDPVLSLDRNTVHRTVSDLIQKKLVLVQNLGGRVDKYQQRFCNTHFAEISLSPAEFAIVTLLLLRGPQTPGELKSHSGRLHEFADAVEVDAALDALLTRAGGPLVARLPREARRKDHCYAHTLGGPVESAPKEDDLPARASAPRRDDAFASLEERVAKLERDLAQLREALGVK
jgi:uncharacterized protein YceH (UPF0502 family)